MASTTDNFNLDLYDTGDPAALTDQYNSAMHTIDETLLTINGNAGTALQDSTEIKGWLGNLGITNGTTATELKNTIDQHTTSITTNTNAIATNTSNISELANELSDVSTIAKTNKSDIAAINVNLNALHANSTEDATNLYDTVQKINKTFQVKRKTYTNIVVIGDSITYGTGASSTANSWANKLQQYIGADSVQNKAQNNSGYLNSPTFKSQLESITNKTEITQIIIAGGANDKTYSATNITNAVKETLQYAITNFPNAEIYVAPVILGVLGIFRYHQNIPQTLNAIIAGMSQIPNIHLIEYGWEWLNGREDWASMSGSTMDTIHPNDTGQNELLRLFAESLFSEHGIHNNWSVTTAGLDNHGEIIHSQSVCTNGVYTFNAQVKVVNNHPAYGSILQTCHGLSMNNNYHISSSYYTGNTYVTALNNRGIVACTTAIPNNTEIYMTESHLIGA